MPFADSPHQNSNKTTPVPRKEQRSEDASIAFTWDHFYRHPDQPEWLLRLPMTKGAVRAMDAVEDFVAKTTGNTERKRGKQKWGGEGGGCPCPPPPNQKIKSYLSFSKARQMKLISIKAGRALLTACPPCHNHAPAAIHGSSLHLPCPRLLSHKSVQMGGCRGVEAGIQ